MHCVVCQSTVGFACGYTLWPFAGSSDTASSRPHTPRRLSSLLLRQLQAVPKDWAFALHIVEEYNEPMLCPNDRAEMHQVRIVAHYGQQIIVDQCERCGGIWFDRSELFRAKQGEAEKIELLNAGVLRTPSTIEDSSLICPRDQRAMYRFTDKYFPQDIILVRCSSCHGIWLNRGVFTKYQRFRQGLVRRKPSSPDKGTEERIAQLMASYEGGRSTDTLRGLGEFLSTPVNVDDVDGVAGVALRVLLTILSLFIRA